MNTWQDIVNGGFEAAAGLAVLNHCRALYRDKEVRGLSVASTAFFSAWGVWNIYYYPHLDQFYSFVGGIFVTVANAVYLGMLAYYLDGPIRNSVNRLICRYQGCNYDTPVFRSNCLYFCTRCGKEITGRGFDDLEPMNDEDIEQMHREIEEGSEKCSS